jgi:hypothetical protein
MARIIKKRAGFGLRMATVEGRKGTYLFMKGPSGGYHAFLEVAAKEAARDCGARGGGNSRQLCKQVCGF